MKSAGSALLVSFAFRTELESIRMSLNPFEEVCSMDGFSLVLFDGFYRLMMMMAESVLRLCLVDSFEEVAV
jgi:hypothetical protein